MWPFICTTQCILYVGVENVKTTALRTNIPIDSFASHSNNKLTNVESAQEKRKIAVDMSCRSIAKPYVCLLCAGLWWNSTMNKNYVFRMPVSAQMIEGEKLTVLPVICRHVYMGAWISGKTNEYSKTKKKTWKERSSMVTMDTFIYRHLCDFSIYIASVACEQINERKLCLRMWIVCHGGK